MKLQYRVNHKIHNMAITCSHIGKHIWNGWLCA